MLFSFSALLYICYLALVLAASHSMDKTALYNECVPHTFYNISYHQSNCLQYQMMFSYREFFRICFCKPMVNIRTKNMMTLKTLVLNWGTKSHVSNSYCSYLIVSENVVEFVWLNNITIAFLYETDKPSILPRVLSSAMLLKLCIRLKFISTDIALEFLSAKEVKLHSIDNFSCFLYYISILELINLQQKILNRLRTCYKRLYISHRPYECVQMFVLYTTFLSN